MLGAAIDRARALLQLPDEAIVHAAELGIPRVPQVEVGEEAPQADGDVPHQGLLDLAEPAHEPREQPAGNPVGEQEIEVLLLEQIQNPGPQRHGAVNSIG